MRPQAAVLACAGKSSGSVESVGGKNPVRVVVADDHAILREGLRALFKGIPGLAWVGEAADGREAVRIAEEAAPDLVIMDITMPGLNGVDATRQILAKLPRTRVLALSMHTERRFVLEMLRAGASGYVSKENAFEELSRAIEVVSRGDTYLSPKVSGPVVDELLNGIHPGAGPDLGFARLTSRERQVLQLLSEGLTTKEIAAELHISPKTVETHRLRLMKKLDVHNLAELVRVAVREGLTPL
jgi:DNA-binding NarL/FixJ family response regulator